MRQLSIEEINAYKADGFLKVPGLFDEEIALEIQREIWMELDEKFGIKEYSPSTWKTPLYSPRKAKYSPINKKLINDDFRTIIDTLIGKENWKEPNSWGGFLVTFPTNDINSWSLHDKLWHWDYELFREDNHGALLIFSFYSVVSARGGGTLLIKGSHRLLNTWKHLLSAEQINKKHSFHRKEIQRLHPYLNKLTTSPEDVSEHVKFFMEQETVIDKIPLQVIELTGNPGDVVFCHPRLIHAPAGINLNDHPRMMRTKFLW
jgi:hypothetical protein